MAILSARIAPEGWVLEIVIAVAPGSFASYQLDPDGSRRLRLASTQTGFQSGGGAFVPSSIERDLTATVPLRLPVDPNQSSTRLVAEIANGDGSLTVRLALSEFVYADDQSLTLTALAGWRLGEADSIVPVSNASTVLAPSPIARWCDVPLQVARNGVVLEFLAYSHHPQGTAAIAGATCSLTDGNQTRTVAAVLATSPKYTGKLRCYRAIFSADMLAGLQPGSLRGDYTVYPWLGPARTSDPAGTASMANLAQVALGYGPQIPTVVAYDPDGSRYGRRYIYVDPLLGNDSANPIISADPNVASLGPCARTSTGALAALARAGGGGLLARSNAHSLDGVVIRLKAGTHTAGLGGIKPPTTGTTAETWLTIEADPAVSDRSQVVLRSAAPVTLPDILLRLAGLTIQLTSSSLVSLGGRGWWFDGCEIRGAPGQESGAAALVRCSNPQVWFTGSTYWNHGSSMRWCATQQPMLVRECTGSGITVAPVIAAMTYVPPSAVNISPAPTFTALPGLQVTDQATASDNIVAQGQYYGLQARVWAPSRLLAATAGGPALITRNVCIGNVWERIGSSPEPMFSIGEKEYVSVTYVIVESNDFVGERSNCMYDDPDAATIADANARSNHYSVNRIANNVFDHVCNKSDCFDDPDIQALRKKAGVLGATGFRPQCTGSWPVAFGAGLRDNVNLGRNPIAGLFRFDYLGLGSAQFYGAYPGFVRDACEYGSNVGGGDYRLLSSSLLLSRADTANIDQDANGISRALTFAAGALEEAGQ